MPLRLKIVLAAKSTYAGCDEHDDEGVGHGNNRDGQRRNDLQPPSSTYSMCVLDIDPIVQ